jgi:hypothetical protein
MRRVALALEQPAVLRLARKVLAPAFEGKGRRGDVIERAIRGR